MLERNVYRIIQLCEMLSLSVQCVVDLFKTSVLSFWYTDGYEDDRDEACQSIQPEDCRRTESSWTDHTTSRHVRHTSALCHSCQQTQRHHGQGQKIQGQGLGLKAKDKRYKARAEDQVSRPRKIHTRPRPRTTSQGQVQKIQGYKAKAKADDQV